MEDLCQFIIVAPTNGDPCPREVRDLVSDLGREVLKGEQVEELGNSF